MRHEIKYSTREQHPDQNTVGLNPKGAGRCAHVVACNCGHKTEGRGNTKAAAEKRAGIDHRRHVREAMLEERRIETVEPCTRSCCS